VNSEIQRDLSSPCSGLVQPLLAGSQNASRTEQNKPATSFLEAARLFLLYEQDSPDVTAGASEFCLCQPHARKLANDDRRCSRTTSGDKTKAPVAFSPFPGRRWVRNNGSGRGRAAKSGASVRRSRRAVGLLPLLTNTTTFQPGLQRQGLPRSLTPGFCVLLRLLYRQG